jgi:5-methylcytosine-specific restriction enzyme A
MPMMPARKCAEPTCPNDGTGEAGRCPTHSRERARGSRTARGYDEDWQRLRARHLRHPDHVCCARCAARGVVVLATEVHHRIPFTSRADPGRLDPGNLESLCAACHDAAHTHTSRWWRRSANVRTDGQHRRNE